jgi:hypothetical protein
MNSGAAGGLRARWGLDFGTASLDEECVGSGRILGEQREEAFVLGIEPAGFIVGDDPQGANRAAGAMKRNQKELGNFRFEVGGKLVVASRVRKEQGGVSSQDGATGAQVARDGASEKVRPLASDGMPTEDLSPIFLFQNADAGGVRLAEVQGQVDEVLKEALGGGLQAAGEGKESTVFPGGVTGAWWATPQFVVDDH